MRTKALLSLAALAACAITASAQVYSANIVGYYNVTAGGTASNPQFTLMANQLNIAAGNSVLNVLGTSFPDNMEVWTWNGSSFDLNASYGGGSWDDDTVALDPGKGFFMKNSRGEDVTVTFVGEVLTGNVNLTIPGSQTFSMIASKLPTAGNLETDMGLTPNSGDEVWTWNGASYDLNAYYGPAAWDADPIVTVGQGIFYKNNAAVDVNWNRVFNP